MKALEQASVVPGVEGVSEVSGLQMIVMTAVIMTEAVMVAIMAMTIMAMTIIANRINANVNVNISKTSKTRTKKTNVKMRMENRVSEERTFTFRPPHEHSRNLFRTLYLLKNPNGPMKKFKGTRRGKRKQNDPRKGGVGMVMAMMVMVMVMEEEVTMMIMIMMTMMGSAVIPTTIALNPSTPSTPQLKDGTHTSTKYVAYSLENVKATMEKWGMP